MKAAAVTTKALTKAFLGKLGGARADRGRMACAAALLAALALPLPSGAQTHQPLNRFENGEVADADEVNENFDLLLQRIEALEAALASGLDADGDGFTPATGDCDDADPNAFPGAPEVCDGVDNDCSAVVDDGDADQSCSGLGSSCGVGRCLAGGTCGLAPANAGTLCRSAVGSCDVAEFCDGSSTECPANGVEPAGSVCRPVAGSCDVEDVCDGASATCPDALVPSGVVCRGAAGVCDAAESCNGLSPLCPANAFQPAGVLCRPGLGGCDGPELCTGSGAICPADPGCSCLPPEQDCGGFCAVNCP